MHGETVKIILGLFNLRCCYDWDGLWSVQRKEGNYNLIDIVQPCKGKDKYAATTKAVYTSVLENVIGYGTSIEMRTGSSDIYYPV